MQPKIGQVWRGYSGAHWRIDSIVGDEFRMVCVLAADDYLLGHRQNWSAESFTHSGAHLISDVSFEQKLDEIRDQVLAANAVTNSDLRADPSPLGFSLPDPPIEMIRIELPGDIAALASRQELKRSIKALERLKAAGAGGVGR